MTERFANTAQTTLNGGIDASTTTVVVTSAAAFPTSGNFRILIDSELLLVTAVSSNTFTVSTRGTIEGTSAASHSNGATVTHVLTAVGLTTAIAEGGATAAAFVGAKAYSDATQSISDITETAVTFNVEEYDTDTFHDNSTNTSRFTIPTGKAGKYLLVGGVTIAASAASVDGRLWWRLNGSTGIRGGLRAIPATGTETGFIASTMADLVAGDYVELVFFQDSSGARNIGHASLQQIQSFGSITLLAGSIGEFVGARAYHNTTQSATTGVVLVVALNSERYDTHSFHDTSTNNSRMTVPTGRAGKYLITGHATFAGNASGVVRDIRLLLNGTTYIAAHRSPDLGTASEHSLSIATVYDLAVGDYVEMGVLQDSGGGLNVQSDASYTPELSISLLALNAPATEVVAARAYHSTTQTVTAGVEATVLFDSEEYDTHSIHDTSTNTGRFTVPAGKGGKWHFTLHIYMAGTPGAFYAYLRKNGTTTITGSEIDGNAVGDRVITATVELAAGDYIEARAFRTTGTTFGIAGPVGASNSMEASLLQPVNSEAGYPWTEVAAISDQTVTNNATHQADTELAFAVDAGTYDVEFTILYSGNNASGDFAFRFTYPAVPTLARQVMGWVTGINTSDAAFSSSVIATSTTAWPPSFITGTDASHTVLAFHGKFEGTFGSSGTLQFEFANGVAGSGRESTRKAGSVLRYRRLR